MNDISSIYADLAKNVDHARLKEISVDIIARYREKDLDALRAYAALLGIKASGMNHSRLFAKIIQNYHPDKLAAIRKEIESRYRQGSMAELVRLRNTYLFPDDALKFIREFDAGAEERYSYGSEDFGYHERTAAEDEVLEEEYFDSGGMGEDETEDGFLRAVNRLFVGNLDYRLTVEDLNNLEVELDLSDSDISDLKGIEHCLNVTVINLSGNHLYAIHGLAALTRLESLFLADNQIESIESLSALANLRELDISFNNIEDLSALLSLEKLCYVNVLGNPVKDPGIIDALAGRGVIVIR